MGASKHVDAVDLVERKAVYRMLQLPSGHGGWTRLAEPLGGKSNTSRRSER